MSEQDTREVVELPNMGDAAFGALMDALAPEETPAVDGAVPQSAPGAGGTDAPTATGTALGGAAADGGSAAPAGSATEDGGAAPVRVPEVPGESADGGTQQPAAVSAGSAPSGWTVDAATVIPKFGELSSALEETVTKGYQQQAFDAAREEYGNYFDALEKHPRLLVGTDVPAIGKEGMERLKNSDDAREWQEAVRSLLIQEIREQAQQKMEESAGFLETVHASIDLFKNNKDLIPGTKDFDRELADTFAKMATPYEVRVDGKLQGYNIPVQPIIDNLRAQLTANRTVQAAAPAAPAAPVTQKAEPPQAGIASKAGSSAEKEDFSTLFGTIGLPHLQI